MCGRYALTLPPEAVRRLLAYSEQPNFPPRTNIAPTQPVPVVRLEQGVRRFVLMRWGFLPAWVKDPKEFPLVINIRSESARARPSFRNALARRRCLMPADGFYEWQKLGREKRPWLIRRPDRGAFAFAALWECWHAPDGGEIDTVALLTGPANGALAALHERCPVVLDPADWPRWLDPGSEETEIDALLKPPPEELFELVPIGPAINRVAHDGPEVQQPAGAAVPPPPAPRRTARARADSGQGELF